MIIKTKKMLPLDIEDYNKIMSQYQEEMLWKINNHMDGIAKSRAVQAERESKNAGQKNQSQQSKDSGILKTYDQASSEIEVIHTELQKYMIRVSFKMFENETQSLAKVFELSNLKV